MQIKISPSLGLRSSLAYLLANQEDSKSKICGEKLQDICSDFLSCMNFDSAKSTWKAVLHNSKKGVPNHIHLTIQSGVRIGI